MGRVKERLREGESERGEDKQLERIRNRRKKRRRKTMMMKMMMAKRKW